MFLVLFSNLEYDVVSTSILRLVEIMNDHIVEFFLNTNDMSGVELWFQSICFPSGELVSCEGKLENRWSYYT